MATKRNTTKKSIGKVTVTRTLPALKPEIVRNLQKYTKFASNLTPSDIVMACMLCPKPFLEKYPDTWTTINDSRFQILRQISENDPVYKDAFETFMGHIASTNTNMHDVWDEMVDVIGIALVPTHHLQLTLDDIEVLNENGLTSYNLTVYVNDSPWWKTIGTVVGKLHPKSVKDFFPYMTDVIVLFNEDGKELVGEDEMEFASTSDIFSAFHDE